MGDAARIRAMHFFSSTYFDEIIIFGLSEGQTFRIRSTLMNPEQFLMLVTFIFIKKTQIYKIFVFKIWFILMIDFDAVSNQILNGSRRLWAQILFLIGILEVLLKIFIIQNSPFQNNWTLINKIARKVELEVISSHYGRNVFSYIYGANES
jgi:hypothetical protein